MGNLKWCCDCRYCIKKYQKHNRHIQYICKCERSELFGRSVYVDTKVCNCFARLKFSSK